MPVFALHDGRIVPAADIDVAGTQLGRQSVSALRDRVLDLIDAPLFPIAWQTDIHDSHSETLLALDQTGSITTIEVMEYVDNESLLAALARAGRYSSLGRDALASLYGAGEEAFSRGWNEFLGMCPPHPTAGPRLFLLVLKIDSAVRPVINALAGAGLKVLIASVHDAGTHSLISIDEVKQNEGTFAHMLSGSAPARENLLDTPASRFPESEENERITTMPHSSSSYGSRHVPTTHEADSAPSPSAESAGEAEVAEVYEPVIHESVEFVTGLAHPASPVARSQAGETVPTMSTSDASAPRSSENKQTPLTHSIGKHSLPTQPEREEIKHSLHSQPESTQRESAQQARVPVETLPLRRSRREIRRAERMRALRNAQKEMGAPQLSTPQCGTEPLPNPSSHRHVIVPPSFEEVIKAPREKEETSSVSNRNVSLRQPATSHEEHPGASEGEQSRAEQINGHISAPTSSFPEAEKKENTQQSRPAPFAKISGYVGPTAFAQAVQAQENSRRRLEARLWESAAPKESGKQNGRIFSESLASSNSNDAVERAAQEDGMSPAARLLSIARRHKAPFTVVWQYSPTQTFYAEVTPWGTLSLINGGTYADPTVAARAASNQSEVDGWSVWKVADGRSLGEL